jgi:hypothetical protein
MDMMRSRSRGHEREKTSESHPWTGLAAVQFRPGASNSKQGLLQAPASTDNLPHEARPGTSVPRPALFAKTCLPVANFVSLCEGCRQGMPVPINFGLCRAPTVRGQEGLFMPTGWY